MELACQNFAERLDTRDISADRRVETWRDVMWDLCCPMTCESDRGPDFRARVVAQDLGTLGLRHMWSDPYRGRQTKQTLARAKRGLYVLTIATEGSFAMSQYGREVTIDLGTAALHSTMDEIELTHTQPSSAFIVTIPAERLKQRLAIPEEFCAVPLSQDGPAASVFFACLKSVADQVHRLDDATRDGFADRLIDLLATAVEGDLAAKVSASSVRAHHLRRVKTHMMANLHRTDLSAKSMATALGLSVRYVHDLFRDEPVTIGAYLRQHRLMRVRDALADPQFSALTIAEIAYRNGFHSSTHFTTCFREEFGCSPKQWRQRSPSPALAKRH